MTGKENRTVWSSRDGDLRKQKRQPQPRRVFSQPPEKQTAYLHRESKGRGGKVVTVIRQLVLSEKDMKSLAKQLKQACGTGGAVKGNVIEIQGEQREKIAAVLEGLGYRVKIAGG